MFSQFSSLVIGDSLGRSSNSSKANFEVQMDLGNRVGQKRKLETEEMQAEVPSVFQLYWSHQHAKNTSRPEFDGLLVKK